MYTSIYFWITKKNDDKIKIFKKNKTKNTYELIFNNYFFTNFCLIRLRFKIG